MPHLLKQRARQVPDPAQTKLPAAGRQIHGPAAAPLCSFAAGSVEDVRTLHTGLGATSQPIRGLSTLDRAQSSHTSSCQYVCQPSPSKPQALPTFLRSLHLPSSCSRPEAARQAWAPNHCLIQHALHLSVLHCSAAGCAVLGADCAREEGVRAQSQMLTRKYSLANG